MSSNPEPRTFLVFGANGHIGGPAVEWILQRHPTAHVRAATSSPKSLATLAAKYPKAEAIIADYLDLASLEAAFKGVDAAFIIAPDFLDEKVAMGNVAKVAAATPGLQRLIRLIGDPPGLREESEVSEKLRSFKGGTAVQHARARKALSSANVPVVYYNIAAWFMEDFATFLRPPLIKRHTLVMPYDRTMNFIATRDIGRGAAELMLDPSRTEVGQTYHMHNGVDMMLKFSDVPQIFTAALGTPFFYDDSVAAFLDELGDSMREYFSETEDAVGYYLAYCEWEREMTLKLLAASAVGDLLLGEKDFCPQALGFEPLTFTDWVKENRAQFVG